MKERDYFRAKDSIKKECEDKLRALDVTWTVMNGTPPPKLPQASIKARATNGEGGESLAAALISAIAGMPSEFNTVEVDGILRKLKPDFNGSRSTITHALKRLANSKSPTIEIIETGKGKRSTTYRKLTLPTAPPAVAAVDDEFKDL